MTSQISYKKYSKSRSSSTVKLNIFTGLLLGITITLSLISAPLTDIQKMILYAVNGVFILVNYVKSAKRIYLSLSIISLVFFYLYVFLSIIYTVNNEDISYFLNKSLTNFVFLMLLILYINSINDVLNTSKGIVWGIIITILIVIFNEFDTIKLRGFDYRMGYTLGAEVTFGKLLVLGMMILFLWSCIQFRWRYVTLSVIFTLFIILSQTRKSLVLVIIFYFVFFIFSRATIKQKIQYTLSLFVIFIIIIGLLATTSFGQGLFTRYLEYFSLSDNSVDYSRFHREQFINFAIQIFPQKPFFGFGIDGFRFMNKYYGNGIFLYSHNTYTELLVNFGLIGFGLFIIPLIIATLNVFLKRKKSNIYLFLFASAITLLVDGWFSIFITNITDIYLIYILFFILLPTNQQSKLLVYKRMI